MKTDNVVKEKSLSFGIRIVKMVRHLLKSYTYAEHPICTHILKCGTSIGANIRESEHGKEANESLYWLEILYQAEYIDASQYESMNNDCIELNKLLISIINTLNKRN